MCVRVFCVSSTLATAADLYDTVTVTTFPNDVLLGIFDCFVKTDRLGNAWHTLVHVCQRWRRLVLGSPHRLKLKLVCTDGTPVKKTLDVWPGLPIVIKTWFVDPTSNLDNIIAALEHNDRVHEVDLMGIQGFQAEKVLLAMQRPFPELTGLTLRWNGGTAPVFPDFLLDGSAPRLQTLHLHGIPSPTLQKLLLSATDIVTLNLGDLSRWVDISPEEFATCLSMLTRLGHLFFGFKSPQSRPDQKSRHPPPPTRIVLPNLTNLIFEGVGEYLEDFVARIDAPLLNSISIEFFGEPMFDTVQLVQLIKRAPKFNAFKEARVIFFNSKVEVTISNPLPSQSIMLGIECRQSNLQLSSLAQVCGPSLLPLPTVEHLYIYENRFLLFPPPWKDDEITQWLALFQQFTALKNLYLSNDLAPRIMPMFRNLVGERVAEVLPALQNIFLQDLQLSSGPVLKAIRQFVKARKLSGHPVTVHHWNLSSP